MTQNDLSKAEVLPYFELLSSDGTVVTNENILGKMTLMFLYPKNNTPTCTKEAKAFSENIERFKKQNINVFGVSNNSVKSHKNFIKKHSFRISLLSDENNVFIKAMRAWVEKKMYGKAYFGTERTTILVSNKNEIIKIWRKVKVNNHVEEVLDFIIKTRDIVT